MPASTQSPEVVVVGAGAIGLAVARALALAGLDTICVGPPYTHPGTAALAAGAMLGAIGEVECGWTEPAARAELDFRVAAQRRYAPFLAELTDGGASIRSGAGTVIVANLVSHADRDNLAAMTAAAAASSVPTESMAVDTVPGLRPARGHEPVAALFLPAEGWVVAADLLAALDEAVRAARHGRRVEASVTELIAGPDRVTGVALAGGDVISAGHVVLAAGAGIAGLTERWPLPELAPAPRLLAGKGVSLLVDGMPEFPYVLRTPNRDFACGTHVVPQHDGGVYLGATNRIAAAPAGPSGVSLGEVHALLHSAMHEINTDFRTAQLRSARYGLRPLTADHVPLLGGSGIPGLSIATGTYRNGILMTPLFADLLADEIVSGRPAPDNPFAPLAPHRARGDETAGTRAFTAGIRHLTSFILEPGGHLPYDRQRELAAFLTGLGRLAVADEAGRDRLRQLLGATPLPELVPQLFYELAAADRHGQPWPPDRPAA
jgi:glycine oxidase